MTTQTAPRQINARCVNCGGGPVILSGDGLHCNQCNYDWPFETAPNVQNYVQNVLRRAPVLDHSYGLKPQEPQPQPVESTPNPVQTVVTPDHAVAGHDDLTKITGIGPSTARALSEIGIATYSQLAAMSPDGLKHVLNHNGIRYSGDPELWIISAKALLVRY